MDVLEVYLSHAWNQQHKVSGNWRLKNVFNVKKNKTQKAYVHTHIDLSVDAFTFIFCLSIYGCVAAMCARVRVPDGHKFGAPPVHLLFPPLWEVDRGILTDERMWNVP